MLNSSQEEFVRLMKQAGWSDAETARRIDVSRAAISLIRSGKNTPSLALEKLRLAVANATPGSERNPTEEGTSPAVVELRWRLEYLARHDAKAFKTITDLINTLYDRSKNVNLGPDAVARVALANAVGELEKNPPVVFGRSRGAASTSGKTSEPKSNDPKP